MLEGFIDGSNELASDYSRSWSKISSLNNQLNQQKRNYEEKIKELNKYKEKVEELEKKLTEPCQFDISVAFRNSKISLENFQNSSKLV